MSNNITDFIDFTDCSVYFEKKPGEGEDAIICGTTDRQAYAGVFDGCGGAGAKKYPRLGGHTGAYHASRVVAKIFDEWFGADIIFKENAVDSLKAAIVAALKHEQELYGGAAGLMGSMSKTFPTTAAAVSCSMTDSEYVVNYYWAGDSRVFLLDANGLSQLSKDETSGHDPRSTLIVDGVLTNVVNISTDFHINAGQIRIGFDHPFMAFAATDGCFGYYPTPMDFEYVLLQKMKDSSSVSEWLSNVGRSIGEHAQDDYSLSMIAVGYAAYAAERGYADIDVFSECIRRMMKRRTSDFCDKYPNGFDGMSDNDKMAVWHEYQKNYFKYMI